MAYFPNAGALTGSRKKNIVFPAGITPAFHFKLNGDKATPDLADDAGNLSNLTWNGTERWGVMDGGLGCAWKDSGNGLQGVAGEGGMSTECAVGAVVLSEDDSADAQIINRYNNAAATDADYYEYWLSLDANKGPKSYWQDTSGGAVTFSAAVNDRQLSLNSEMFICWVRRESAGSYYVQAYINGKPVGVESGALAVPEPSATNGRIAIGRYHASASNAWWGGIRDVFGVASALTAAQVMTLASLAGFGQEE